MNIIEAVKSGKKFRKFGCSHRPWQSAYGLEVQLNKAGLDNTVFLDEYELEPEKKVEITEEMFWAAAWDSNKIFLEKGPSWFLHSVAEKLGLK